MTEGEKIVRQESRFAALAGKLIWPGLIAAVWLVQGGILWGNFYLDDYFYLHLARAGAGPFALFAKDLWFGIYYRPGFFPLFWLIHHFFEWRATAYLAVNLALVTGTVLALYDLCRRWLASRGAAFWAALLFAVSPTTAIGAHFVWNLTEVLGLFLAVVSLRLFWQWLERGGRGTLAGVLLIALWAMLCKENLAILPAVAWLAARTFHRRREPGGKNGRAAWRSVWPLWVVLAIYLIWRTILLKGIGGYLPLDEKIIDFQVLVWLAKLLAPNFPLVPWLPAACLLALAGLLIAARDKAQWRIVGLGLAIALLAAAPMAINLRNPIMALFLPMRFFYAVMLGLAIALGAAAAVSGRKKIVATLVLALLTGGLAANAAKLAWDFSAWQNRRVAAFRLLGWVVRGQYADAPDGTLFYFCESPNDHALDAGIKYYFPEYRDRYLFLYCAERTEVVATPETLEAVGVPTYFDRMLRKNPVVYGDLQYGVAGADRKKVERDLEQGESVVLLQSPFADDDPLNERFFPRGRDLPFATRR
jgi:hypothetical protein